MFTFIGFFYPFFTSFLMRSPWLQSPVRLADGGFFVMMPGAEFHLPAFRA
jgi:hypothetical protein